MCTIQENNNKNLVIEVTPKLVEKQGPQWLIDNIADSLVGIQNTDLDDTENLIAGIEVCLDIIKHHYNIGREVTAAKTNHLNALKTLIK